MKHSRINQLALLTAAVMAITIASATQAAEAGEIQNSLKMGSWSMQFRITENFQLSSFDGATISVKKHLSDKSAIRLGMSLSYRDEGTDSETEQLYTQERQPSRSSEKSADRGMTSHSLSISARYLYYFRPSAKVNSFIGGGPGFGYRKSETSKTDRPQDSRVSHTSSDLKGWSFGGNVVLGAEWFATKSISFLAEYGLTASKTYTTRNDQRTTTETGYYGTRTAVDDNSSDSDKFSITSSGVKFGLSVYF